MADNAKQQMSLAQQNMLARQAILGQSVEMVTQIYSSTLTGTIPGQVINIAPRNVGLIKKFIVQVDATLAQAAAETLTRSQWGPANFFSQVIFTDLSNLTRINTTGWHLHALATARRNGVFGAAYTHDSPVNMGASFSTIKAPASITTAQAIRMFYEVPVAYGDSDLRGAIPASVVNATMNLQLVVNPNLVVGSGGNPTLAMYQSSTAGNLGLFTGVTITVYQVYLDQLPQGVLPIFDISTAYFLNQTTISGLAVAQQNPISYANHREFLSTMLIYDNNGVLNAASDITRFQLQGANTINFLDVSPFFQTLVMRNKIGNDFPLGSYWFDHRAKPINTMNWGNTQLLVTPSSVSSATGSVLYVGWESFAIVNVVTQAGSLPAG
jgi:hypothetical protein